MEFITNIIIYPSNLTDLRLDCRLPYNKPYMLISFDYIREPETNEAIIRKIESEFVDFEDMKIIPVSVREVLNEKIKTTYFKEKLSLS